MKKYMRKTAIIFSSISGLVHVDKNKPCSNPKKQLETLSQELISGRIAVEVLSGAAGENVNKL
jgi:hypothetical protein